MKTIVLRLAPEVREKLEIIAKITGKSPSSLVADAVGMFVDGELDRLVLEIEAKKENEEIVRTWSVRV